jgi:hypothetical protein
MARLYIDISFVLMLLFYIAVYRWFVGPALKRVDPRRVLQGLLLLHCWRAVGFTALMPGLTLPGLDPGFAIPVAYGDVATSLFALIGATALQANWSVAVPWIWFMNIFGLADILYAGFNLERFDGFAFVGSEYFLFVLYVPALLISHVLIFRRLLHRVPAFATA